MTPFDDAFKDLSEFDPEALLLLLGAITPDEHAVIEPLSRELRAAKQIADQPYLIRSERGERIAHVEAQTQYQGNEPDRLLDYGLYLWLTYQREYPVESYLLVLSRKNAPAQIPSSHTVQAGSLRLTINYRVLGLWQLSATAALALQREELLPFIPLMEGGPQVLETVAEQVNALPEDSRRGGLAMSFFALGSLQYDPIQLLSLIGRDPMLLRLIKETPGYHILCDMARADGREEGREEARHIVIRMMSKQIARRFPAFATTEALEPLQDFAALEQLFQELDQFDTAEGLQARIAELTAKQETPTQ